MLLSIFLFPLLIAVAAIIYRLFLAHEPVLSWWFQFGSRFENKWYHAPIWGCVFCIAGQIALWSYVINWILSSYYTEKSIMAAFLAKVMYLPMFENYSVLQAVIFVSMALAYTKILNLLYNRYLD